MDPITKATSDDIDPFLQRHLAEMESQNSATDTIPIPLKDAALARQTRLQLVRDEIADLHSRLGDLKVKASRAGHQAADVVKTKAKWADESAHQQLGSYPWAKLAGITAATFVGTRLLRMLPFGGILSIAAPLVISQIKAKNERASKR
jgi:hypothetical protein